MAVEYDIDDDIRFHAQNMLYYNNLLIKQCDSWLSPEEGNRNMMERIAERKKDQDLNKIGKMTKINFRTRMVGEPCRTMTQITRIFTDFLFVRPCQRLRSLTGQNPRKSALSASSAFPKNSIS